MAKKERIGVHTKSDGTIGDCYADKGKCPLLKEGSLHAADEADMEAKLNVLHGDAALKSQKKRQRGETPKGATQKTTAKKTNLVEAKDNAPASVYGFVPEPSIVEPTTVMYDKDPYEVVAPSPDYRRNTIYPHYDRFCRNAEMGDYCGESYCHDGDYRNVSLDRDVNIENYVKEYLKVDEIPDDLKHYISFTNQKENFVVYRRHDYYSYYPEVAPNPDLLKKMDEIVYSNPNVYGHNGALSFARMNGVDTSGMRELDGLKTVAKTGRITKALAAEVDKANRYDLATIPFKDIKMNKTALHAATPANISMRGGVIGNPKKTLGVVLKDSKGDLIMVSGDYSRVAAAMKSGRKNVPFYVISHDPKQVGKSEYDYNYEELD